MQNSKINKIFVTKPDLPELGNLLPLLEQIWSSRVLTNGGPYHQQLEKRLSEYLEVDHISLFSNGTIALITALKSLNITGEVITTPYSFVATAHSLLWNGITPVFVDIDPETLNLNPKNIEAAITERTTAILPVHCYGRPCDVDEIQRIADKNRLSVVYDAAHAFGVRCHCGSILNHGDLSVLSFHATKVFNTFEGGAVVSRTVDQKRKVDQLKNFGFVDETAVVECGINGKMSELNSAIGILQLSKLDELLKKRKKIDANYREAFKDQVGITCVGSHEGTYTANYSYFPILVDEQYPISRDSLYEKLKEQGIYARRYFYPLISEFPMYKTLNSSVRSNLPVSHLVASQILCLPIYPDLSEFDQERIIKLITN